jgi:diguanylate cyclase (GGDEF)-like protein/PAS domain S-box-containing protein
MIHMPFNDQALMEALPQPWCVLDAHGVPVRTGQRWHERFGVVGAAEAIAPEYRAELLRRWREAQGRPWNLEARWHRGPAQFGWALLWMQPLADGLWLATLTDTDAQRAAETQLREADAVWKLALEATGDGVWDWDVAAGTELFSPNMLALYGYRPDEVEPTPEFFDRLTHPDDRAQMAADRQAHFDGRAPLYRNEHRVRCKDGSYKWILTRGMVISRAPDGRPLRVVGTHTDITERKATEVLAWKQANFDALTGLPNRRMLAERLEHDLKKAQRTGRRLALLMLDLDHFKAVNDDHGHDMGDCVLIEAAQRIKAGVRETDMVARLGGDEFVVLMGDLDAGNEVLDRVAGQLVKRLSDPYDLPLRPDQAPPHLGSSVGISLYPDDADNPAALHKHADQALYAAKRQGRGTFHYFTDALQQASEARARLGQELRTALADKAFVLRFLPQRRLGMPDARLAEVLLRWRHPTLGELGARSFMPGAESSGLVHEIGDWLLRESAEHLRRWREQGLGDVGLSVTLAGSQLRQWGQSVPDWTARLMRLGASGLGLTLNIDEAQLRDAHTQAVLHLPALRAAGIQLSLDGFGEGPCCLASLQHRGLARVVLARSLCQGPLQGRPGDWVRSLIALAHAQGLVVLAQGVDRPEQARALQDLGVDGWQGDWVSPPLDAEAFTRWLQHGPAAHPS